MARSMLVVLTGISLLALTSVVHGDEESVSSASGEALPRWMTVLEDSGIELRLEESQPAAPAQWPFARVDDEAAAKVFRLPAPAENFAPFESMFLLIPMGPDEPPICFDGPPATVDLLEIPPIRFGVGPAASVRIDAPYDDVSWMLQPPYDRGLIATPKPPKPIRFEE